MNGTDAYEFTSQVFFDEAVSNEVFSKEPGGWGSARPVGAAQSAALPLGSAIIITVLGVGIFVKGVLAYLY